MEMETCSRNVSRTLHEVALQNKCNAVFMLYLPLVT